MERVVHAAQGPGAEPYEPWTLVENESYIRSTVLRTS
jgi:hypothetical protein